MSGKMVSGLSENYYAITRSFLACAYIEQKSDKPDKAGLARLPKYEKSSAWSQKKSDRNGASSLILPEYVRQKSDKPDGGPHR